MQRIRLLVICCGLACLPLAASAYEGVEVSDGGAIRGTIGVSDTGLKDGTLTVTKDNEFCGAQLPAEKVVVSSSGGLANAVVMIEGIARGRPVDTATERVIANSKCRFVPHVAVAPKGGMMKVRNDDSLLHNSHFYLVDGEAKRNVINIALPKEGLEIGKKKILRKPGLLSLECDAHEFMQAWVWVLEHPYGAVTGADGTFSLEGVPPGNYTLRVWHEQLGEKTADVSVQAGQTASVDLKF